MKKPLYGLISSKMHKPLPIIMVAPNGARKTKSDHPAIPVTIAETAVTAKACFQAGAGGIHAHLRNENQEHILDAGMYRELIQEISLQAPDIEIQITTESVGKYSPQQQRELVKQVKPPSVSISLREITDDGDLNACRDLFHWAQEHGIAVQHILYAPEEIKTFCLLQDKSFIPPAKPQLLYVLGRYATNLESSPADLDPFIATASVSNLKADWAVCAFGKYESNCAKKVFESGGKFRVGFENSVWNEDGSVAGDNAERVTEIRQIWETQANR